MIIKNEGVRNTTPYIENFKLPYSFVTIKSINLVYLFTQVLVYLAAVKDDNTMYLLYFYDLLFHSNY